MHDVRWMHSGGSLVVGSDAGKGTQLLVLVLVPMLPTSTFMVAWVALASSALHSNDCYCVHGCLLGLM